MAMNRETKRMLQRQGHVDAEGNATRPQRTPPPPRAEKHKRASFRELLRDVKVELKKVAWPTRTEVINYSTIVLVAVVVITIYVAALDWAFGEFILRLFQ